MSETLMARWPDFLELTKPRVVALMLITALIGMCMAVPGFVPWEPLILGNLGIGLCAGAAAAINHVVDERIDPKDVANDQPTCGNWARESDRSLDICSTFGGAGCRITSVDNQCINGSSDRCEFGGVCLYLHHVLKAGDAAKYCDWWFGWCGTTTVRLDCCDR